MSDLDSGQFSAGIVWVNSGAAVGSFGVGNDSTGDGTVANPYLSIDQALKEWRIAEGQAVITKQVTIRAITDDTGASYTYTRVTRTNNTTYPETGTPAFYIIIEGWAQTWGTTTKGKWTDINDKPEWGAYTNISGAADQGIRLMLTIDFTLKDDTSNIFDFNCTVPGDARQFFFYHCRFTRPTVNLVFNFDPGDSAGIASEFNIMGCTFDKGLGAAEGRGANNYIDNDSTGDCQLISDGTGLDRFIDMINTIYLCDGVGFFCLNNTGNITGWLTTMNRTGNVYDITGGASFLIQKSGGIVESVFTTHNPQDIESQALDPDLAVVGEPALADTSPVLDKGVSLGGVFSNLIDPTGNDNHIRDALGEVWGDSLELDTPLVANAQSRYTQRGIGPIQNPKGVPIFESELIIPKGEINFNPAFAVGRVGTDPDALGTCQAKVTQADDTAGAVNRKVIHSSPLNITATDNKVDVSEDGGGDVLVTIPVAGYNTLEAHQELEDQLNGAGGLSGVYTVDYNVSSDKTTISATGLTSGFELKFNSGTNAAENLSRWFGYDPIDTAQTTSLEGDVGMEENGFNSSLTWEFSTNYTEPLDPAVSGAWNPMGTGDPTEDFNDEGTNGVRCDGLGGARHVRVNLDSVHPMFGKKHGYQEWNGKMRTTTVPIP